MAGHREIDGSEEPDSLFIGRKLIILKSVVETAKNAKMIGLAY